jgi:predicted ArsR family transcriptional regulator
VTTRAATEAALTSIGVLADDVRRDLYFHVRDAANPISRDEAAELAGISRNLAAFHLEKLVAASLLEVTTTRRPLLRRGRAPKLYYPADTEVSLSLPPRRYETMARVLITAVHTGGDQVRDAVMAAAREHGRSIGEAALRGARVGRLGVERAIGLVRPVLEDQGYEPETQRGECPEVLLRNCPFHGVLAEDTLLVCTINTEVVAGIIEGMGAEVLEANLIPRDRHCCVTVAPRARPVPPAEEASDRDAVEADGAQQ